MSSTTREYDVFPSFHGPDVHRTFISHLLHSLAEKSISVFETETLKASERLLVDIRSSKIAIVVISEKYASSAWCLGELADIVDCRRGGRLVVLPVFYGVQPSDVRRQTGNFGEQFLKQQRENPNEIQSWRAALTDVGSITGLVSDYWEDEAELIQEITDETWNKLSESHFFDPLGIHLHMRNLYDLLYSRDIDEVREIGIFGMGGIGKTTIARYVYRQISHSFDVHILLDDVTKIHQDSKLKFLAGLKKKILLLADGVDTIEQIAILRKEYKKLLGPGSTIIFTCQDKNLFIACGIRHLYQVEPMDPPIALKLFSSCAFKQSHPPLAFANLSDRAVKLADGLPFMLAAVGSELFGRSKEEWELVLSRYERSFDVSDVSKVPGRSKEESEPVLSRYERSFDEGTLGTGKNSFDVSKVPGRSKEEWKMVLSKYEQSSDEGIIGTSKSGLAVSDDDNSSLARKKAKFNYVGMDCHIQAVCSGFMKLNSDKDILIVGIWGVGGIGKTTLARCMYEETMSHFHTHSFLENVGKIYQDHCSLHLKEDVLLENIQRSSKNGSKVTKAGFRNRKVLLVVDGVDNDEQIEDVKKVATWFGAGSRVIVTTRDENLLVDNGVKHVYEVKCLKVHEALKLFYQFAFKQQTPSTRFKGLSVRAVQLSGRIPLALEVLASFLQGKSENEWESVLQKLERQDNDEESDDNDSNDNKFSDLQLSNKS